MNDEARRVRGKVVISARKVRKVFDGNVAVDDVSLDVSSHEVVAVVGPSGAGKSTFLRCLNLLDRPDAGTVELEGASLTSAKKKELAGLRRRIGIVFQQFNLFPHLSATDNVTLAPIYGLKLPRPQALERAHRLLRRVGLDDKLDAYPRHLSGGQQQRVAIARALAMNPSVILFDEPTSALDAEMVSEVLTVIKDLAAEGMTMVIVSHEIGFVNEAADRVVFMDQGQVVEEAPPSRFFSDPQHARSRQFVAKIL